MSGENFDPFAGERNALGGHHPELPTHFSSLRLKLNKITYIDSQCLRGLGGGAVPTYYAPDLSQSPSASL